MSCTYKEMERQQEVGKGEWVQQPEFLDSQAVCSVDNEQRWMLGATWIN